MRWLVKLAPAPACLLAGACSMTHGLGRLPGSVVELCDQGRPDGWMELEAGRNRRILEIEIPLP